MQQKIFFTPIFLVILLTQSALAKTAVSHIDHVPTLIKASIYSEGGNNEKMPGPAGSTSLNCGIINKLIGTSTKPSENLGDFLFCAASPYGKDNNHWLIASSQTINTVTGKAYGGNVIKSQTFAINLAIINDLQNPQIFAKTPPLTVTTDGGMDFELKSLDMANYDLGVLGKGIGLRVTLGYVLGGRNFDDEYLMLFVEKNHSLQLVFDQQIAYLEAGGDVQGDQDPPESVTDSGLLLVKKDPFSKTGIPNLIIKYQGKKQTFVWNTQTSKFVTADKEILDSISEQFPDYFKSIKKSWSS